jgi:hypothetical protein
MVERAGGTSIKGIGRVGSLGSDLIERVRRTGWYDWSRARTKQINLFIKRHENILFFLDTAKGHDSRAYVEDPS